MPSPISNPSRSYDCDHNNSCEYNTKKCPKIPGDDIDHHWISPNSQIRWRSEAEQRIYSSKLFQALQQIRYRNPASTSKLNGSRRIREAANRVLAVYAKGRTRWSRAILSSPLCLKSKTQQKIKKVKKVTAVGYGHSSMPEARWEGRRRRLPAVERKVRVLSRLVPGCRNLSFPSLLEETTDYIAALEMQVRAMKALAELLTGGADRLELELDSIDRENGSS